MLLSVLVLAAGLSAAQGPAQSPPPDTPEGAEVSASARPGADPASAAALIESGLAQFRKRRYTQAEIDFRRALEADPGSAAAAFYLGYTYYKQVEPRRPFHPGKQKAAEMFARAYELDPKFRPVWAGRR